MENNTLISAKYYPSIPRAEIISKSKYHFSLDRLTGLGSGFSIAAAEIAKAAKTASSSEGLYRCEFPKGLTGHLASAKDGSGLLGTVIDEHGIAGQARWIPVEGGSVTMAIDPVTLEGHEVYSRVLMKLFEYNRATILEYVLWHLCLL